MPAKTYFNGSHCNKDWQELESPEAKATKNWRRPRLLKEKIFAHSVQVRSQRTIRAASIFGRGASCQKLATKTFLANKIDIIDTSAMLIANKLLKTRTARE